MCSQWPACRHRWHGPGPRSRGAPRQVPLRRHTRVPVRRYRGYETGRSRVRSRTSANRLRSRSSIAFADRTSSICSIPLSSSCDAVLVSMHAATAWAVAASDANIMAATADTRRRNSVEPSPGGIIRQYSFRQVNEAIVGAWGARLSASRAALGSGGRAGTERRVARVAVALGTVTLSARRERVRLHRSSQLGCCPSIWPLPRCVPRAHAAANSSCSSPRCRETGEHAQLRSTRAVCCGPR
jgi:hypothetical protein